MTNARIVLGSTTEWGSKIRTYELTYPRFIHSELMTHRVFSRNAASSRAIPVRKMLDSLAPSIFDLFERFGTNQSGMQPTERQVSSSGQSTLDDLYSDMLDTSKDSVLNMIEETNVAKQVANRFIEPFMHMTTIVTATEMNNFFYQRCDSNAQEEFQSLAYKMLEAELNYDYSQHILNHSQWHLPFVTEQEKKEMSIDQQKIISVARCASVSYVKHNEERSFDELAAVYNRMLNGGHWSPFEHPATPMIKSAKDNFSGNFRGWYQLRKDFMKENKEQTMTREDLEKILQSKPSWVK